MSFEDEIKIEFLEESEDLIQEVENAFLALEDGQRSADLFNEIFRLAHNLKGTSKAVGFDQLSELTHYAETLILKMKENEIELEANSLNCLLKFKDKVSEMIEGLKNDLGATFEIKEIIEEMNQFSTGGGAPKEDTPTQEEAPSEPELNLGDLEPEELLAAEARGELAHLGFPGENQEQAEVPPP